MVTPYHVEIAPAARRQFLELSPKQRKLLIQLVEALSVNPRPPGSKKLEGMTGLHSETLNHLRLIYKIEDQEILLLVIKVA